MRYVCHLKKNQNIKPSDRMLEIGYGEWSVDMNQYPVIENITRLKENDEVFICHEGTYNLYLITSN